MTGVVPSRSNTSVHSAVPDWLSQELALSQHSKHMMRQSKRAGAIKPRVRRDAPYVIMPGFVHLPGFLTIPEQQWLLDESMRVGEGVSAVGTLRALHALRSRSIVVYTRRRVLHA